MPAAACLPLPEVAGADKPPLAPSAAPGNRRGLVVVIVLVALAVVAALFASMLRMAGAGRHEIEAELRRAQAECLAQSALERAAARLFQEESYRGETWTVPAAELPGDEPGAVSIAVEPDPADARRRLVTVRADYPDDPLRRCRVTRQAAVLLPSANTPEPGGEP